MAPFMRPFEDKLYAAMRIVVGFLFLFHGTQKLLGWPKEGPPLDAVMGTAGGIELVGGALVMVGLLTRWSAFLCSGLMAVAYWMAHGTKAVLPLLNGGELAALYCFVFLYISARGAGIWSVDAGRGDA